MGNTYTLNFPVQEADIRKLALGDMVYLDGEIVMTAGLPTHQRIVRCLENGTELPTDLTNAGFFHLGSYNTEDDGVFDVLYLNPTTSTRFNEYMPTLIRSFGLRAVGGKGGLDRACAEAMKEVGCVYLSFLGGGCTVLSEAIREVTSVSWNDMISHYRIVKLRVEQLGPLTVAIDAHGNSLYDNLQEDAEKAMPQILADLRTAREAAASGDTSR
ncbi:fumarate hydratase C-terminal domain-containing protein [Thalassobaculum sp.]|uniref:fumarate hydratase C-terminal domain-containing protein n=1 Tax=Thalassobaculum sp. TaxID=2022740 RepID=UPI0032EAF8D8